MNEYDEYDEYVDEVDDDLEQEKIKSSTSAKQSKSINTATVAGVFAVILILGSMALIALKPKNNNSGNIINVSKVERPVPVNTFSALNISQKIPKYKQGERFSFEIIRDIFFTGRMTNVVLKIKLPEDISGRQKIYNLEVIPKPNKIVKKTDGKYAYINFTNPKGEYTIKIKGEGVVRTYNLETAQKINRNIDEPLSLDEKDLYLASETGIETKSRLINMVKDEIPTATNDIDTVKNIFDYVFENLKYDKKEINKDKGALKALESGRGVCEEFAKLFVTLCRVKGIPARVAFGFDMPFKDTDRNEAKPHSWAEVYFPEYGWVAFDPTNDLNNSIKQHAKELHVTPYDLLAGLVKYKSYLTVDSRDVSIKYEGSGNITSKNLRIKFEKL